MECYPEPVQLGIDYNHCEDVFREGHDRCTKQGTECDHDRRDDDTDRYGDCVLVFELEHVHEPDTTSGSQHHLHMSLNCSPKCIGPLSVNSQLFMPKILDMNDNGSWIPNRLTICFLLVVDARSTHKHNSDNREHHDSTSLSDGLLGLPDGLPGLHYTCLLLFQCKKIVDLWMFSSACLPESCGKDCGVAHTVGCTLGACPQSF